MDPNSPWPHRMIGAIQLRRGVYARGLAEMKAAAELSGGRPVELSFLGQAYALAGERAEAQKLLKTLVNRSKRKSTSSTKASATRAPAKVTCGLG
jgi:predicted Zn-dependent protease